jgi:pimeloyl-ACP methyl ester carboxylesterase
MMKQKFFKWILISVLGLPFLFVVMGFIYEQISRSTIEHKFPVQGKLVSVGDHKLNIHSSGTAKPVVVFESGLDIGGSLVWSKVQPEISKFSTAVSYDRAGVLWSERGSNPKTCEVMAEELYTLLKNSNHPGPYILVGHSMAGYMLRSFIKNHSDEVAGIVFVDVSHPDQLNRFPKEIRAMMSTPPGWITILKSSVGITRWFASQERYPATLENDPINNITNAYMPRSLPAVMEELTNFEKLGNEAGAISSFGDIPLIVITGTGEQRMDEFTNKDLGEKFIKAWMEMQTELLSLSSDSRQIKANKSGHYVQLEQPELVIEAVRSLINGESIKAHY